MHWIIAARISPMMHGGANIFDNYFTNRVFKNTLTLLFFSSLINVLFLPLVFLIERPELPSLHVLPWLVFVGLTDVLYLYPYYKALQEEETSIVTSLFSLGQVLVPILAFFLVREVLTLPQYAGFFIIILSSIFLTYERKKKVRFNKSLLHMGLCSLILALEAVAYKYIFEEVNWATGFSAGVVVSFVLGMLLFVIPSQRKAIIRAAPHFKTSFKYFFSEELLTFAGSAAATYAIAIAPVSVVESIGEVQPFFVLIYAMLFRRFLPKVFKEKTDEKHVLTKFAAFACMIVGILLVTL